MGIGACRGPKRPWSVGTLVVVLYTLALVVGLAVLVRDYPRVGVFRWIGLEVIEYEDPCGGDPVRVYMKLYRYRGSYYWGLSHPTSVHGELIAPVCADVGPVEVDTHGW